MKIIFSILFFFSSISLLSQSLEGYPVKVQKLLRAYAGTLTDYKDGYIILKNGSRIKYNEGGHKSHKALMNSEDIGDIFTYTYIKGTVKYIPENYNPGRIRNEELLKLMYEATDKEVRKKLTRIVWCPGLVNQKLQITTVNGIDKQLQKISDELDQHPEFKDYLKSAGTFNWRKVRGTNRLSSHSFGTAIDLNVKYSNYWQWDCRCTDEDVKLKYKNRIPQIIVDIFEKHGFIWGGKWYHYDTMHFEYRPELLIED